MSDPHTWGPLQYGSDWTGHRCRACGIWRRYRVWSDGVWKHHEREFWSGPVYVGGLTPECRYG